MNSFLNVKAIWLIVDYAMILVTILSISRLDKTPQLTVLTFLTLSVILYLLFYENMSPVTELISTNLSLVSLFILVPLLGLPIHFGGYIEIL